MGTSDPEGVAQWLADYDAANRLEAADVGADVGADVAFAERGWSGPPREPQAPLPLTGGTLVEVPGRGEAPEPWPGARNRNWWRDLAERTTVGGCERAVLMVLVNRIWTGENDPRLGRENGRWTGFLAEIQAKCGGALSYRSAKRGVAGLMARGVITRRIQGRRRERGGGRGRSVYRILPANRHERR